ncbi:DivIVA domain-containing protein [Luteimicrobium subarcticum]|uniref:DivIVA domain-containing protein n=1 Tax=Luteimicrobium subarcticum TaxID=620910 RepID=A0A2M8W769_9MICO|nr:DivIVA domain-containing protein [Luteimicrobium subarcticum]PJI86777.1 DivIVA domain-containing protein [Luteimicrobium subarcticum]
MISAEDVLSTTFRTTRFRGGYDIEAVDDYLDQVTRTLAVHEGRTPYTTDLLSAEDVRGRTFEVGKLRESYVAEDVDALLARIAEALDEYEKRAATRTTGAVPAVAAATPTGGAPTVPGMSPAPADRLSPAAEARLQEVGGAPVPDGATLGLRVLTSQLQIATVRARGSDVLTVRTPEGATLRVVAVDAGADGVVLRTVV